MGVQMINGVGIILAMSEWGNMEKILELEAALILKKCFATTGVKVQLVFQRWMNKIILNKKWYVKIDSSVFEENSYGLDKNTNSKQISNNNPKDLNFLSSS